METDTQEPLLTKRVKEAWELDDVRRALREKSTPRLSRTKLLMLLTPAVIWGWRLWKKAWRGEVKHWVREL